VVVVVVVAVWLVHQAVTLFFPQILLLEAAVVVMAQRLAFPVVLVEGVGATMVQGEQVHLGKVLLEVLVAHLLLAQVVLVLAAAVAVQAAQALLAVAQ
jgi:hypothetical protein